MPDRAPQYRFRGNVRPCAEVARPTVARRNVASESGESSPSSATLDIFDVVDSFGGWWGISARDVDAALAQVGDVDTLYVRVNSPGGEATEGVAIANLLRAHSANVHVTVYGLAASAASYISTAGDTVSMAPGSMMMIHEAWSLAIGSAEDMLAEARALDALGDSIASLYALKAGGAADDWRALMREETWYTADAAVEAGLADRTGIEPAPAPETASDAAGEAEAQETLAGAAARFDLSMFARVPEQLAARAQSARTPQTPAEPPETHNTEEADSMSDTLIQGLRERFGLAEDADEAAITAKLDELEEQATKPPEAAATKPTAATPPEGFTLMRDDALDELRTAARAGAEARAVQLRQDRDETIQAAVASGRIAPARADHWRGAWDADPEGTRTALASLEQIYPTTAAPGYASSDEGVEHAPFTDAEAGAFASLLGTTKEALTR